MTQDERQARLAIARAICDHIMAKPLPFVLNVRAGIITPAIPARLFHPDFTRKRHIRRNDGTLPCAILRFRRFRLLPPYKA